MALLALGREWLLRELLPMVPAAHEREVRLLATAIAIAEREAAACDAPARDVMPLLEELYGEGDIAQLFARLAADLRAGAFEICEPRARAARAILWRLTIVKLREGNPAFLAENGFGD